MKQHQAQRREWLWLHNLCRTVADIHPGPYPLLHLHHNLHGNATITWQPSCPTPLAPIIASESILKWRRNFFPVSEGSSHQEIAYQWEVWTSAPPSPFQKRLGFIWVIPAWHEAGDVVPSKSPREGITPWSPEGSLPSVSAASAFRPHVRVWCDTPLSLDLTLAHLKGTGPNGSMGDSWSQTQSQEADPSA